MIGGMNRNCYCFYNPIRPCDDPIAQELAITVSKTMPLPLGLFKTTLPNEEMPLQSNQKLPNVIRSSMLRLPRPELSSQIDTHPEFSLKSASNCTLRSY
jgi:hypothetical protein